MSSALVNRGSLAERLKGLIRRAEEDARRLSSDKSVIGFVTSFEMISIGEREVLRIDIPFELYLSSGIRRGEYIGIRTITQPVVVVGVVSSISRSDLRARLGIRELSSTVQNPVTIATDVTIDVRPLAEVDVEFSGDSASVGEPRPVVTPIDPQSPVFRPAPWLIERALGIPGKGIVVGRLYSGGREIEAYVRFDEDTLTHHVVIIGTTGYGKTTLMKRMLVSGEELIESLVVDRQGDFVRLAIEKLESFAVLMPVTRSVYEMAERRGDLRQGLLELFASRYDCRALYLKLVCSGREVDVIPYAMRFKDVFPRFHKITPYLSAKASMAWSTLVGRFLAELEKGSLEVVKKLAGREDEALAGMLLDEILVEMAPKHLAEPDESIFIDREIVQGIVGHYSVSGVTSVGKAMQLRKEGLYVKTGSLFHGIMKGRLAPSTIDSIVRTLKAYDEYGLFIEGGKGIGVLEPRLDPGLFNKYRHVIVDLSWVLDYAESRPEAIATIVYELLSSVFNWRDRMYKENQGIDRVLLILLDEAHEYFPQTQGRDVAKETVEELINKLMRLGRVRKIGLVMATHTPEDLNPLILQLANTRIVTRNDPSVLRRLGFEEYQDLLAKSTIPKGLAVVRSIKFSDIVMRGLLP